MGGEAWSRSFGEHQIKMLMDRGVIDTSVGEGRPRMRWLGQERVIQLGGYTTRVGID